jgi:16S rRNA processing protein RimM
LSEDKEINEQLFAVGRIAAPHGLDGKLKVFPLTQNPEKRFSKNSKLLLKLNGTLKLVEVVSSSVAGKFYIIKLKESSNRTEAESLKGSYFFVERSQLKELQINQFWIDDVLGCAVFYKDKELGRVSEIIKGSANDSYVVKNGKELIVPAVKDAIEYIDVKKKIVVIKDIAMVVEV